MTRAFLRQAMVAAEGAAYLLLTACGGGGDAPSGPANPPNPPAATVATVEVIPASVTLVPLATVQLTATPRDAQGGAMSGKTVEWASAAPAVASVSSSGLVTAVGGGTATVTATVDGKQGNATITVAAHPDGPVVARADIGASGGTLGNADIGVTIPAGALAANTTVQIVRDTLRASEYPEHAASAGYLIDGLPADRTVPLRVRIKPTMANTKMAAIAVMRPALAQGDGPEPIMGTYLARATDSAGFLVATQQLSGRPPTWGMGLLDTRSGNFGGLRLRASSVADPLAFLADAQLTALVDLENQPSGGGNFDVWGFGRTSDLAAKVTRTAQMAEAGKTAIEGMGFSFAHRTAWPMQVIVKPLPTQFAGLYVFNNGTLLEPNRSYIAYRVDQVDRASYPEIVIHELFHLAQHGFIRYFDIASYNRAAWLGEATATWAMEFHPSSARPYMAAFWWVQRDSLFGGFSGDMTGFRPGYGKAPLFKYITKRWGADKVREIYTAVQGGTHPITAVLNAVPEPPKVWWPAFLHEYLGGSIYPYAWDELRPSKEASASIPMGLYSAIAWPVQRSRLATQELPTLGVHIAQLLWYAPSIGSDFELPIFLDTASSGNTRLSVYLHTPTMAAWRPLGTGDTVFVPGHLLKDENNKILITITPTAPAAPYTARHRPGYRIDASLPIGDYYFDDYTNVTNNTTFTCDQPGTSVSFDPAENASDLFALLSSAGSWQRIQDLGTQAIFRWQPTPAWQDSLTKYKSTVQSTITAQQNGRVIVNSTIAFNSTASVASRLGGATGRGDLRGSPWWYALVPIAASPFALRRRRRVWGVVVAAGTAGMLVACGVGQISMAFDESYRFVFDENSYTLHGSPSRPNDVQVRFVGGDGQLTLNSYRSEFWKYVSKPGGGRDSVRTTCNGSGGATFTVGGSGYRDGAGAPSDDDLSAVVGRLLGRNVVPTAPNHSMPARGR